MDYNELVDLAEYVRAGDKALKNNYSMQLDEYIRHHEAKEKLRQMVEANMNDENGAEQSIKLINKPKNDATEATMPHQPS